VGVCGGFSTFSTFSYENFLLFREGFPGLAVANVLVNVVACLAIFFVIARTA
jgi:CrcB protein